jgi:hypothetical protein
MAPTVSKQDIDPNELSKRVPLDEAMDCIARYKQKMANLYFKNDDGTYEPIGDGSDLVRGFAVLHADLLQVLGITSEGDFTNQHFRVYFGIAEGAGLLGRNFKYYLVPMLPNEFTNGSDQIPTGTVIVDDVPVQEQYVYDFNSPCPKTCDQVSDLYKAGDPVNA